MSSLKLIQLTRSSENRCNAHRRNYYDHEVKYGSSCRLVSYKAQIKYYCNKVSFERGITGL